MKLWAASHRSPAKGAGKGAYFFGGFGGFGGFGTGGVGNAFPG